MNTAVLWKNDADTSDKIAINLIKIFNDGPLVSFNGSPTVSPITAASCSFVCFLLTSHFLTVTPFSIVSTSTLNLPYSTYFLALSHAPPVFDDEIAICTPDTIAPGIKPATAFGPKITPTNIGVNITNKPGPIISFNEAFVEIATHLS